MVLCLRDVYCVDLSVYIIYFQIANGIVPTLESFGIEVKFILTWSAPHATENEFIDIIENTYKDIRSKTFFLKLLIS